MAFIIFFFFFLKFEKVEKTGIIATKFSLRYTPYVILGFKFLKKQKKRCPYATPSAMPRPLHAPVTPPWYALALLNS
jgi:hypothetical protein